MIAFLADAFVKASIILLVAAAVGLMLRGPPAAPLRPSFWALACGAVLALPLVAKLVPNVGVVGWPRLETPTPVTMDIEPARSAPPLTSITPRVDAPRPSAAPSHAAVTASAGAEQVRIHVRENWTAWIVPLWLTGVGFVLMLLGIGLARITWLAYATSPMLDDDWLVLLE